MNHHSLLTSLLRYKAWADEQLIAGLAGLDTDCPPDEAATALGLLNHLHIVDRIFVANLQGRPHGYRATAASEAPAASALFDAIRETDRWLVAYAGQMDAQAAVEPVDFRFTDGAPGRMSREEMLGHLVAHGGYHRGEIGRILTQLTGSSPRDTFTGYLHEVESERHAA